ncbi:CarboxypepD_reg-like domain-containing protein [Xylanibacter ruminicola]|uniref:CarboxypepD_reg-like domain-containing protein n=1 Tax=Xylanibacter ruminicola TaxID=839 RepID=A0A1H3Y271_XYLRU|nr:outer membrane beta-barrel family protein [Xylanibacter ruminicola]SEA05171.1 CarboxypepD_reg-like domain-containing protein [Xylanibacter ruminicola]
MKKLSLKMVALIAAMMMCLTAEAKTEDVGGRVIDMQGEPLPFVSVALLTADSTYIQGATSDVDGYFQIMTTDACCILRFSYIGYRTKYVNVEGSEIGTIQMEQDQTMLNEIVVKGQMPKTKLTGNSMITTIQGTVLGQSGTAKEMLAKVPGMTLKGEDLEVLGKGTPVFYINGRKMRDKDELKRLRSEEIQSVEVITNPGAEYDATISAVVRIKTVRREGSGFGFDLMAANNQDLAFGFSDPSSTLNLRYRRNNLDLFGMVNYWSWDSPNDLHITQSTFLRADEGIRNILQDSHMRNDWHGEGLNYNLGFNWQINDKHSLGARVERHDQFKTYNDMWVDTENSLTGRDLSHQGGHTHYPYSWQGNAYYNGQVNKLNIDLNVDFLTDKENDDNQIDVYLPETQTMQQNSHISSRLWATKLVLSYPVWKGQLQAGTEMSFVKRQSCTSITNYPLPSTDADVKENNVAAFVAYNANLDKFGIVSAGLRYEHVGFDYTDNLDAENNMTRYQDEFFPNITWSKQFGAIQTSLSYTMKTVRPKYSSLNDHIYYLNSYTLSQGDSKLKNATMQEVSINARWKWINLFAAYERRDNTITQVPMAYNNEGIMLMKQANLSDPVRNLAIFLSANPTWGVYSPSWTIGGQKFWNTMTYDDPRSATGKTDVTFTKPIFFFDIYNTFRFKHSWQLEANANIQTKGDVLNFRILSPSYNVSFVVQKCWLKNDALCLRASISDVFQRSVQDMAHDCGFFYALQKTRSRSHRLDISIRYTFNAQKSKYKGTGAGKAEQQRMSNSN